MPGMCTAEVGMQRHELLAIFKQEGSESIVFILVCWIACLK